MRPSRTKLHDTRPPDEECAASEKCHPFRPLANHDKTGRHTYQDNISKERHGILCRLVTMIGRHYPLDPSLNNNVIEAIVDLFGLLPETLKPNTPQFEEA
ncbi:MAG: hypothetical protein KDD11_00445 [Acidobacteria bacterium]|nr:hypothetical protein [Acidobacteriota bacterium]